MIIFYLEYTSNYYQEKTLVTKLLKKFKLFLNTILKTLLDVLKYIKSGISAGKFVF